MDLGYPSLWAGAVDPFGSPQLNTSRCRPPETPKNLPAFADTRARSVTTARDAVIHAGRELIRPGGAVRGRRNKSRRSARLTFNKDCICFLL